MFKYLLLGSIFFAVSYNSQYGKSTLKNSKSRKLAKSKKFNSNYTVFKSSPDKDRLIQSQKNIRIEIFNDGDWEKYDQTSLWRIVKVNDGNLSQILNTEKSQLKISENLMGTNNWKDENGNFSFRSISEPLKISQEYSELKPEKGKSNNPVLEKEIYETTAPIFSLSFRIYTRSKNIGFPFYKNLSKVINFYSNNELIKSLRYSYEDLLKIDGISIENFRVNNLESK